MTSVLLDPTYYAPNFEHSSQLGRSEHSTNEIMKNEIDYLIQYLQDEKEHNKKKRAVYAAEASEWTLVTRKSNGTSKPGNSGRFLADSGANSHIFTHKHYLQNAEECNQEVRVGGDRVI